ncbi:uncharacterized protein GGS25DRAFT_129867 [Hypoxylon fragiforme]|uniref:uncharacterized protein n=1 Tax=Hypoxylon fragiforme TaxID=63214 RepID=UPI0020C60DA2|nr:uncharacterized protein GGS25DRAFT_129867 [Hypoxylon fragiforme]KAI2612667.1 hypothetical protein GGS25DRAFT_129867 [Hypoxylon fragiforme]
MEVAITSPNCIFRRVTTFCFYLFVAGVTSVRGEQSAAQIIRPGAQQTFHYQDTVEVAYESDFARPWISTWCEVDGLSQEKSRERVDGYNSSAFIHLSFENGSPCWFELYSIDKRDFQSVSSPAFTYIATEPSQTTVVTEQSDSISAAEDTSITSSTTTPQKPAAVAPTADAEPGNLVPRHNPMINTHVVIGVVAGIGGIALGALAGLLFWQIRRGKSSGSVQSELQDIEAQQRQRQQLERHHPDLSGPPSDRTFVNYCHYYPSPNAALAEAGAGDRASSRSSDDRTMHEEQQQQQQFSPISPISPIYPDDSASCYHHRDRKESAELDKAYATDFAMADPQIWNDHLRCHVPTSEDVTVPSAEKKKEEEEASQAGSDTTTTTTTTIDEATRRTYRHQPQEPHRQRQRQQDPSQEEEEEEEYVPPPRYINHP